jgi:hypothetical protein
MKREQSKTDVDRLEELFRPLALTLARELAELFAARSAAARTRAIAAAAEQIRAELALDDAPAPARERKSRPRDPKPKKPKKTRRPRQARPKPDDDDDEVNEPVVEPVARVTKPAPPIGAVPMRIPPPHLAQRIAAATPSSLCAVTGSPSSSKPPSVVADTRDGLHQPAPIRTAPHQLAPQCTTKGFPMTVQFTTRSGKRRRASSRAELGLGDRTYTIKRRVGEETAADLLEDAAALLGLDDVDADVDAEQLAERPRLRSQCKDGPRPCPWLACRYHLALDVSEAGGIKVNQTTKLENMVDTCALDIVERGEELTLEQLARMLNVTRERVRQIETKALTRFRAVAKLFGLRNADGFAHASTALERAKEAGSL